MELEERIQNRLQELASQADGPWDGDADIIAWAGKVLTVVQALRGRASPVTESLQGVYGQYLAGRHVARLTFTDFAASFKGALGALQSDYEAGLLADMRSEVRGEILGDFMAQAQYLLEKGLKDPAAMLVGAVLEDSLRQLSQKHDVPEGTGIESMNVPLKKAGVYGLPQQQQVTAWAAIRNKADHAQFDQYVEEEVRLMHQGVSGFIVRYLT